MLRTFKGLSFFSWLRLVALPIGLSIYILAIAKAESNSSLAYYLVVNLFAIPFSLIVVAFWESFEAARIWAISLMAIQPFLWILFFIVP